jgi:DNA-binding NarL/FixJ family response regulator
MIRVFLADDHSIVRGGVKKLLEGEGDIAVVGEAADGRAVLNAPDIDKWDVLVLDLSLPKVNGIEVLRRLRASHPALRVVVLSMYPEDQYADRMRHDGAVAYVPKSDPPAALLDAIRAAVRGQRWQRPAAAAPGAGDPARPAHAALTAREYQVFTLIFQGEKVTDIAAELNLSVSTVSNHVAHVKEKLGARSIGEIVAYAHRVGLVQ